VKAPTDRDFDAMFDDDRAFNAALCRAIERAARRHGAAGVPMVVRRNGRLAHVPADEILAEIQRNGGCGRRRR